MATFVVDDTPDDALEQSEALFEEVRPLFAGKHPMVVGGAMSQLLALYAAGHIVPGDGGRDDARATAMLRKESINLCVNAARQLIPAMYALYVLPKLREIDGGGESA